MILDAPSILQYNKEILTNFRNETVKMRCANNSLCIFNGVGTFEGIINGGFIKLENVYYSKHINKKLT
jgi:hypothetical protein